MTSQPAFTPTGSSVTSLAGKLARTTRPEPTADTPSDAGRPEPDTPRRAAHRAARTQPPADPPAALAGGAGALRQITFLTPVQLRTRLRAHIADQHTTMRETLLDAIEDAHPRLEELLDQTRPATRTGPLFTRRLPPAGEEVKVQISVRLATDEITTIDRLAAQHAAPDRSTLITVALEHHLPPTATADGA